MRSPGGSPTKCRPAPIRLVLATPASCTGSIDTTAWRSCRKTSPVRSEEHTSELQSRLHLVCRLLLEKKKKTSSNDWTVKTDKSLQHNQFSDCARITGTQCSIAISLYKILSLTSHDTSL